MGKYSEYAEEFNATGGKIDKSLSAEQAEQYSEHQMVPIEYSVTDWENDEVVLSNYEILTDYLGETQSAARYAIDQATTGQTDDPAEYMRDLTFRIGAPLSLAASLKDAPENVKRAYRVMKSRWDKASLTGAGERFDMVKDYGADLIFSPEGLATIGGLLSGTATFGAGTAATVAARKAAQTAGQKALSRAVAASVAATTKNPIKASTIYGATHGVVGSHLMQELDISADIMKEEDYSVATNVISGVVGGALGYAIPKGIGMYAASKHGNKAFRETTEPATPVKREEAVEAFDEGLEGEWIPASGGSVVDEALRLTGPEGATARTVDGSDDAGARAFDMDDEGLNKAAKKFADDLGGGEKTRKEILASIRAAANNETTVAGKTSAIKQALYTVASDISGNFYGKAAGVLSPITKFSGTAAQLQKKLSYEFGVKFKVQDEVVAKDLSEVQREVTGKYNERFRAIVDSLSLSKLDTKLATDINDALSKSMRSTKPLKHSGFDDETNAAINKAAIEVRDLYNEMGVKLKKIRVIDKLQDNYIPRMWSRSAIEKNQEGLVQKFIDNAGMSRAKAEATVKNMLDVKNQVDAGGGGGHFFSAKRKINTIGDDSQFEEFLNTDVLGSLHAYTFQAGKSIAKHRVLGVRNFDDFKRFYINRIKVEMKESGEQFTPKIERQIEKLYRSATGEGMERYGRKTQVGVDAYSFTNRVALLGLATVSSLTEVFLNIQKAGVRNSVKGFGEAIEQSHKRITKDLESELRNKNGLTANEALKEMRDFSIHVDQALAQVGDRLAGDELMTEGLQKASNKFFRLNMLDQWTKFVQNVSHSSGKSLVTENIEKLATRYKGLPLDKDGEILAGELAELGIDFKKAVKWFDDGAKRTDDFYKNDLLGGVARYTNSVVLQPTAMSGLKPLLFSNPKTAVFFQLLSYPAAFTNTVLKGAAKSLIKAPTRNAGKIVAAGTIMTGMARWTNYLRTGGESERNKDLDEIIGASIARWGGNGLLLDSFQRAKTAAKYSQSNLAYATMPFGPAASDTLSLIQQGIIPTVGNKAPVISGSYFGKQILGEPTVDRYKRDLRKAQRDVFGGLIEDFDKPEKALKLNAGGTVLAKAVTPAIESLFKKGGDKALEESLPVPLSSDVLGTLENSTKGLVNKSALSKVASNIEGSVGLGVAEGSVKLSQENAAKLAEANVFTMIGGKKGDLDFAKSNLNFQEAVKTSNVEKAAFKLEQYQKDLGYNDDQILALRTISEIKDEGGSKDLVKASVANEIQGIKNAFDDFNIKISDAERTKAKEAKFDEDSLDATHDFLTTVLKDREPLLSPEGAPIVARDAIVKIAARGNVNFDKFKAPKLNPTEKPDASLTEAQRMKALKKHVEKSDTQDIIRRSIRNFKTSEYNVSFPFARELSTHAGSEGVAYTITLRDMIFDLYSGRTAQKMYNGFKDSRPTKAQYEEMFEQLKKIAKQRYGEDYEMPTNLIQEGYINVRNPLMYAGETQADTWKAEAILASLDGVNELLYNIQKSGGDVTDASIKRMKALRVRALDLETKPVESLVDEIELDLMRNEINIDLRNEIKSYGFDSVKYVNKVEFGFENQSEYSYILFEPEQFKLITATKFDSKDPRHNFAAGSIAQTFVKAFAPKKASGFYSKAEKASQELKGSKPRPGQSFINDLQKKQVTPDELEWTGANERFANNKLVTKEEVQEFFKENDFDFDVNVGRSRPDEIETVDDIPTLVRENEPDETDFFEDWLIENKPFEKEMLDDLLDSDDPAAWDELFEELFAEYKEATGGMGDFATVPFHLEYSFEGANTKNYREVVLTLKDKFKKVDEDFKDDHHPELKNQVAHVRLANIDETDDAFTKTLLIDEVQSDAHQKSRGKNKNYITKEKEKELSSLMDEYQSTRSSDEIGNTEKIDELLDEIDDLDDMLDDDIISEAEYTIKEQEIQSQLQKLKEFEEDKTVNNNLEVLEEKIMTLENSLNSQVPDLPLKKNKQWGALGLRQAMKIAAEEGYDQVALTTGRLQAIRNKKDLDSGEGKKFLEFYDQTLKNIWKKEFADKYGVDIKMVTYNRNDETVELPTLKITDKMRKDIDRGLLMFVEGGEVISEQAQTVAASEPVSLLNTKPTPKSTGRTVAALKANLQRNVA